jgi:hypothetical protein
VSTGAWIVGFLVASLQESNKPVKIEFGWLAVILPVTGFALTYVIRAFTAEDRVRRECQDQTVEVRDSTMSAEIRPALATIIVQIQPYMKWPDPSVYLPGEPGDPELEAARILGYWQAPFTDAFATLEDHYVKIHRATAVHGRRVAHARRCGIAMFTFLIAWMYLSFWLSLPDVDFPTASLLIALAVLAASSGWAAAELSSSNRENNTLSVLAREASRLSGGKTI